MAPSGNASGSNRSTIVNSDIRNSRHLSSSDSGGGGGGGVSWGVQQAVRAAFYLWMSAANLVAVSTVWARWVDLNTAAAPPNTHCLLDQDSAEVATPPITSPLSSAMKTNSFHHNSSQGLFTAKCLCVHYKLKCCIKCTCYLPVSRVSRQGGCGPKRLSAWPSPDCQPGRQTPLMRRLRHDSSASLRRGPPRGSWLDPQQRAWPQRRLPDHLGWRPGFPSH